MGDCMPTAAGDQRPVDGERCPERDEQTDAEAPPEEEVAEPRLHRARHHEDEAVVDDLHHRDRHGVGGERDPRRPAERHPAGHERPQGEQVAEEERENDGESDRRDVAPAECRGDGQAEDLADRAACQAVPGRSERDSVERCMPAVMIHRIGLRMAVSPEAAREADNTMTNDVEVAVIGAGQAGLAMGSFLERQGHRFVILERAGEIAPAWRERWDSLTLFTPRRYSALPGMPFPGDPDGYPTRDEVIAYLESYAEAFELPVELSSDVKRLGRGDDGRFRVELGDATVAADQVVVATGPFQTPYVPKLAERLGKEVFQLHAVH